MIKSNFAIFILTHGRPHNQKTLATLEKVNYTGKTYLIVDNEDKDLDEYKRLYSDKVIVFDKLARAKITDTCDNQDKRNIVLFARNEAFDIAEKLGLEYFLVLDDDYGGFRFRFEENGLLTSVKLKHFDEVCEYMIKFLELSGALTVAFAQTGDLIGGLGSRVFKERLTRKAMNSFFCKTSRKFEFLGRINEDVNAYVLHGTQGKLMFTIADLVLDQTATQQSEGGLTDSYLDNGTYVKSFYSVIVCPSCVKISTVGMSHKRIHHKINWELCSPKIISDTFKKK